MLSRSCDVRQKGNAITDGDADALGRTDGTADGNGTTGDGADEIRDADADGSGDWPSPPELPLHAVSPTTSSTEVRGSFTGVRASPR
jgi:hypothetical protein